MDTKHQQTKPPLLVTISMNVILDVIIVTNLRFVKIMKQDTIAIVNGDIKIIAKEIFLAPNVLKTTNAEIQLWARLFVQAKVGKLLSRAISSQKDNTFCALFTK